MVAQTSLDTTSYPIAGCKARYDSWIRAIVAQRLAKTREVLHVPTIL